jgi:precorrin-3B C17-methyltransferase
MNKIYIVGIGPGSKSQMTPKATDAIAQSQVIIGYDYYMDLIADLTQGKELISTGMKRERDRARQAFEQAGKGKTVAMISSGDAGIYGMAALLWEMKRDAYADTEIEVIAGISAMNSAASLLGAPLGHDFCSISLSDLLTPWLIIDKRIEAAASADFVTAIYNPVSHGRFWQLMRLKEIFLKYRSPQTPVGIARQVDREEESITIVPLEELDASMADMFTTIIIGNSQTFMVGDKMVTPRGYFAESEESDQPGRDIMIESFRTILGELGNHNLDPETLWVTLHTIHTTADFNIKGNILTTPGVVETLHQHFYSGKPPVIVTDVTMVGAGIRKGLIDQLGIEVKCYLNDQRTAQLAKEKKITRTQAGIRLAVEEHPDALFAFGNAPTALIELVDLIRKGKANPVAVVGAPVGFVNVKESKWQLRFGCPNTPHIIVDGRKGGSNVAATAINAVLSWSDAAAVRPGQGM